MGLQGLCRFDESGTWRLCASLPWYAKCLIPSVQTLRYRQVVQVSELETTVSRLQMDIQAFTSQLSFLRHKQSGEFGV